MHVYACSLAAQNCITYYIPFNILCEFLCVFVVYVCNDFNWNLHTSVHNNIVNLYLRKLAIVQ